MNNIVNPVPDEVNAEDRDNLRCMGIWDKRDALIVNIFKIMLALLFSPCLAVYFCCSECIHPCICIQLPICWEAFCECVNTCCVKFCTALSDCLRPICLCIQNWICKPIGRFCNWIGRGIKCICTQICNGLKWVCTKVWNFMEWLCT